MHDLLVSGMFHLTKSKLLPLLPGLIILLLIFNFNGAYPHAILEDYFFQFTNINVIALAVFCPLFLSSEYSDGVLRNKLIIGHTHVPIYLSSLLINILFGGLIVLTGILTGLCAGPVFLGWFHLAKLKDVLFYCILTFANASACTALYTFISMLVVNRSFAAASCILLALGMIFMGQYLDLSLSQESVLRAVFYTSTGEACVSEQPNPAYLTGFARQVYQFFYDVTPGGQSYQIMYMKAQHPLKILGYSVLVSLLVTGIGLAWFRRKDVK